jgi:hypothetical protein
VAVIDAVAASASAAEHGSQIVELPLTAVGWWAPPARYAPTHHPNSRAALVTSS